MSLINDALKKANQKPPQPAPATDAPMVAASGSNSRPKSGPSWVVPVVIVCLVGASGFMFWKWQQASRASVASASVEQIAVATPAPIQPATQPHPVEVAPASVESPVPVPSDSSSQSAISRSVAAGPVAAPTKEVPAAPAPTVPTPTAPDPAPTPAPAAVQAPKEIKLQAILFRLHHPTAILNGRTLEAGQSVDGAKLVEIQRSHVVIERQGQRETLELR